MSITPKAIHRIDAMPFKISMAIGITYMWNLKKKWYKLIYKTEQNHRFWKQTDVFQNAKVGGAKN